MSSVSRDGVSSPRLSPFRAIRLTDEGEASDSEYHSDRRVQFDIGNWWMIFKYLLVIVIFQSEVVLILNNTVNTTQVNIEYERIV